MASREFQRRGWRDEKIDALSSLIGEPTARRVVATIEAWRRGIEAEGRAAENGAAAPPGTLGEELVD